VYVRIDQARHRRHAAGIDHGIGAFDGRGRSRPHGRDALALDDDGIAVRKWVMPVAGDDLTDVDDRDFH
jgi:hypothetical protein